MRKHPSAPSLHCNSESQTIDSTHTRDVTPGTPSKRPRSQITDTSSLSSTSISHASGPTISEIPITPRSQSQPSPTHIPLVHEQNPQSVERYVDYKQPTAIKTVRLQPQTNLVHIPDTEYTPAPSLQHSSESNRTTKIYPPLKTLRKSSASLSTLLDDSSEYTPPQESTNSLFIPHH